MAICNYCGEDKKLIKAHIIPEAFWEIDKDLPIPLKLMSNTSGTYPKKAPIGIYDPAILCGDCDEWIGREFDEYAFNNLLKNKPDEIIRDKGRNIANRYADLDQLRIKRFFISVMWRAHLSERNEFTRVSLGPYAARAKKSLSCDRELKRFDICLAEYSEGYQGWLDPHMTRFDGVNTLLFYINRFMAYIKLDGRAFRTPFNSYSFNNREDIVITYRDFEGSKEKALMKKIVKLNPKAFQ